MGNEISITNRTYDDPMVRYTSELPIKYENSHTNQSSNQHRMELKLDILADKYDYLIELLEKQNERNDSDIVPPDHVTLTDAIESNQDHDQRVDNEDNSEVYKSGNS